AAVRGAGRQRAAGAVDRGRADREGGARQRPAGVVPAVRRRGPRLPQEGQQRLVQRGDDAVLAAAPAGRMTRQAPSAAGVADIRYATRNVAARTPATPAGPAYSAASLSSSARLRSTPQR